MFYLVVDCTQKNLVVDLRKGGFAKHVVILIWYDSKYNYGYNAKYNYGCQL